MTATDNQRETPNTLEKQAVLDTFAKNLRGWRRVQGFSQKELAHKAGVDENAIVAYEKGARMPGINKLVALARALEVSVVELLADDGIIDMALEFTPEINTAAVVARMAGCGCRFLKPGYVTITPPTEFRRSIDGEIIAEVSLPIVMTESAFVKVFGNIIFKTLSRSSDLQKIATDELRKL